MSYILEALRKADAERERGAVPDLHAQLLPGAPSDDEPEARRKPARLWLALVVAPLALLALAWLWRGDGAPPSAAVQPAATTLPVATQAAPVAVAAAASAMVATPRPPAAVASPVSGLTPAAQASPAAVPAPVANRTAAARADAGAAFGPATRSEKAPSAALRPVEADTARSGSMARAEAKPAKAAPATPVTVPPARVPPLNELADELRRQVPPLAIGGSVYSPQAERRMVVVNGQVFQEGATLAPELQLEQIRPKSAVFSIRGQRFELPL